MTRWLLSIALVAGLSPAQHAASQQAPAPSVRVITRIDVFVDDQSPIAAGKDAMQFQGSGQLALYNLDDMQRLNARFSAGLSSNPEIAKAQLAERIQTLTAADLAAYTQAANGQARADAFRIERLPAVVINEQHVYYGARSIDIAIGAYRSGR